ncbi:hypothetical protein Bp8pC_139 [Bacillus phage Bp8p-C]|uniref:Uncharacterized protein n=2 Tax=Agatevirus Bp8pC TaxID=1910937 RepID=A0A0A0PQQ3_9CAUD|nr:hypothetical protein AXJ20_gp209 [Bacillus phage Bp8p-C]YP_009784439.1 hypothetical protein QLX39_gp209 [Bacillus phage Bp8p-T]AHJ87569.1 hypothetical protein Bp8pC_139 [Bacillus phage Bp8p-C]AHJ87780.1 hypothetical protein Bp8pT_139 [Bacillus phage Bp8p-T]
MAHYDYLYTEVSETEIKTRLNSNRYNLDKSKKEHAELLSDLKNPTLSEYGKRLIRFRLDNELHNKIRDLEQNLNKLERLYKSFKNGESFVGEDICGL